ncbi:MAG: hypothetical protein JXQ91_14905 [Vannielia sp.]|uniref:hypothetical protein n=1 Tax=Vannielia sp. TaxID=2813045 RepID=UPI003B8C22BA
MHRLICQSLMVAAALAAPAPALAACPTAADLEGGLRLDLATGETETVTRAEAGTTVSTIGAEGFATRIRLAQGIYPLEVVQLEDGAPSQPPTTYDYGQSPLPAPAPGLEASLEVALSDGAGRSQRHDYSFGSPVTWTYGACAYEVIPVTTRHFSGGEETSREVLHYLPEFGHSYLASYAEGDTLDVYTYVSVEAVR